MTKKKEPVECEKKKAELESLIKSLKQAEDLVVVARQKRNNLIKDMYHYNDYSMQKLKDITGIGTTTIGNIVKNRMH